MSYLTNRNKTRRFIVRCILFLIGLLIGIVFISGITHIVYCANVEVIVKNKEVEGFVIEEPEPELEPEPEPEIINLGKYKLTAYCACKKCCGKSDGITASGVKAVQGVTVAADTRVLPFGTKIIIDSHEYTVQDRGGAIKGNKIDIYFDSHQEALNFGVQYKEVFMKVGL